MRILFWRRCPGVWLLSSRPASRRRGRLRRESERDRQERQREMAEGKEERTGSGATLESSRGSPWSSGAVSAVERVQNQRNHHSDPPGPHLHRTFINICCFHPCRIIKLQETLEDFWHREHFGSATAECECGPAFAACAHTWFLMSMSGIIRSADRVLALIVLL